MGILYILFSAFLQLVQFSLGAIIRKKPVNAIFLRSKVFCVFLETTRLLSQMFSLAALPRENCGHCSGRKPPVATWLLSCPHTWLIWRDREISVGRYFCLSVVHFAQLSQVCVCYFTPICLTCCW